MEKLALIILIITGLAVLLFGVLFLWEQWKQQKARRLRAAWVAEGRTILFGPELANIFLQQPTTPSTPIMAAGLVGVVDDRLFFGAYTGKKLDLNLPLNQVHWLGLRVWNTGQNQLVVHLDTPGGWRVYLFVLFGVDTFAQTLSARAGLDLHFIRGEREDFGPADATRMQQDIYGQWQPDFSDKLYLAPDRLLFAWRNPILLEQVRHVEVIDTAGLLDHLNPMAQDLLRIDFIAADGTPQVVGFQVRSARRWAEIITERAGVPLTVHDGRKKKGE